METCHQKSNLFITTPKEMKALTGSCLQIPCSFSVKPEQQSVSGQTIGMWLINYQLRGKTIHKAIFYCNKEHNFYPMHLTGNLSQKNCTTVFSKLALHHTDTYFFRIQSNTFSATAICNPLQITVQGIIIFIGLKCYRRRGSREAVK